jgi:hypothetical protein
MLQSNLHHDLLKIPVDC